MRHWDVALRPVGGESLPLADLVRLGEERLIAGRVVERAAGSSLYRVPWRRFWRRPRLRERGDLQRLPFISEADLLRSQSRWPLGRIACAPVYGWAASSSLGESRKYIPVGKRDFEVFLGLLDRLARVVKVKSRAVVLAVPPLAPRLANALPYCWMLADMMATGLKLEFIVASMFMLGKNNWPEFVLRRQPDLLLCRPSDALAMAGHFAKASGQPSASPRDILPNLKTGIFFGEALAPHRDQIVETYGLEPYDLYLLAESMSPNVDCPCHQGIHFWIDTCIAEIIPDEELASERNEPGYRPRAVFLDSAAPGTRGELVVSTFAEALPLIRYRSGDCVRLAGCEPCACGLTHPRIEVLGRLANSKDAVD
jgi:phenylacetate-coenzyme A ligase PaaK-like adenylate-forming protein